MQLTINGETRQCTEGMSVESLVTELGLNKTQIAVELNRAIVPRSTYAEIRLSAGDEVEIVRFIGGG